MFWVRLRFDIGWRDLASALMGCCLPRGKAQSYSKSECEPTDSVVCLSVRSGFDLWLSVLRLPKNSEVLMSALTIPHMARIVRAHGLVPVPIDLEPHGVAPSLDSLRQQVTPRSRVLIVAHLFGSRLDVEPYSTFAHAHGMLFVEDSAQVFDGTLSMHPQSDVSMFSFGAIKSCTALGGGVLRIRDPECRVQVAGRQSQLPIQPRREHFFKIIKYAILKIVSSRLLYSALVRATESLGQDIDQLACRASSGFREDELFRQIRRQPSAPLLRLVYRRLMRFDERRMRRRTVNGQMLVSELPAWQIPGTKQCVSHSYWVFPVLSLCPERTVSRLRESGFDATDHCRLAVIDNSDPTLASNARRMFDHLVFLPWYPELPRRARDRMLAILKDEPEFELPG